MSNAYTILGAGERLSFFKLFSEKKFKVEIPIIQRDYAQGRTSEREVRDTFLNALFQYLQQGKPNRDLDFVYGTVLVDSEFSRFVPLDGQQRLTTLFLLHWYLAHLSNQRDVLKDVLYKNNKSQFSYETRTSSSDFCDALMLNDIDMSNLVNADLNKKNSLSNTIKDKGWFYLSWTNDPTIQSMLMMLDSIHSKFFEHPEYFQLLIDEDEPVITFLFLNLETFKLTDDLYIKMNARGKPLTGFENFKAKFEQRIKSFNGDCGSYKLDFKEESVNGYQYFIHKIDTDWADLFWNYRNTFSEDNTYDDELMNFLRLIISNYHLLSKNTSPEEQTASREEFFESGGKLRELSFIEYSDLGCFSEGLVEHLIQMLNLLYNNGSSDGKIKPYLKDDAYYSEDMIFKKVIKNEISYPDKLRFYAFYAYLAKKRSESDLTEWLRVIYNLTENTIINTSDAFNRALSSINKLSKIDEPILNAIKNGCDISGFIGAQILEEKIKAHLLLKSQSWTDAVKNIERHPYFHGQVGFILNFSGILEHFQEYEHCDWGEEEDSKYFSAFEKYAKAGGAVFKLIDKNSADINYFWERAVLSKGMYFTESTADRANLLSTRLTKNNIERDHSWRRLLRLSSNSERLKKQEYVKSVFDDPVFDSSDIASSLNNICINALDDSEIEFWRKAFIKYEDLFEYCKQGFISFNEKEIILLKESQRNHYHRELYTKVLQFELNNELNQLKPFNSLDYNGVKTRDEYACVVISNWDFNENVYSIHIGYYDKQFNIWFKRRYSSAFTAPLTEVLIKQGFEPEGGGPEGSDDTVQFVNNEIQELENVRSKIINLCSDLRKLTGE
jgi:hypothetical protein